MQFVCDVAAGKAWLRIETQAAGAPETEVMEHGVEEDFRGTYELASQAYNPGSVPYVEQDIGRAAYIRRAMPTFLTLRDGDGVALVTAMLPPAGQADPGFRSIVVGQGNSDPYPAHGEAIDALGRHF